MREHIGHKEKKLEIELVNIQKRVGPQSKGEQWIFFIKGQMPSYQFHNSFYTKLVSELQGL